MAIEGPLRELGIHDVFQLLDLSRKTGVLRVTSELRHNAGTVYFDGGTIIFAEIRTNPHPLGALLLRTGKITEADLERGRDMQQRQGDKRRIGEILVALGAITPRELERQVRFQIEEVVFEMMSWREGYFSFTEGPLTDVATDATVRIPTEALLMEGARRIDEWSRIEGRIPHLGVVPALAARPACTRMIPPCTCCSGGSSSRPGAPPPGWTSCGAHCGSTRCSWRPTAAWATRSSPPGASPKPWSSGISGSGSPRARRPSWRSS